MQIKTYKISEKTPLEKQPKPVWVLCTEEVKAPEHLSFLEKVLSSVQVNLHSDTQFKVFSSKHGIPTAKDAIEQEIDTKIILFGLTPANFGLHIDVQPYAVQSFKNLQILWTENLSAIQTGKDQKLRLWNALKILFPQ